MSGFRKNPGNITGAAALLLVLCVSPARALEVETSLHPQRVRVGSTATLRVKISGAGSVEPVRVPPVEGLDISFSGTQRSFEFINGRTWSGIVLTYRIVPGRSGTFTIPPLVLNIGGKSVRSQPVQLIASGSAAAAEGTEAFLRADVSFSKTRAYEGEPVLVRYYLVHAGLELRDRPIFEKLPQAKGALLKHLDEDLPEESITSGGGAFLRTHVATFAVIPAEHGSVSIGEGTLIVSMINSDGFFSFPRSRKIECPGGAIQAVQVPSSGKPADYKGDVGSFTLSASYAGDAVKIFDGKKVTLTVKGRGNLLSVSAPVIDAASGLKILSEIKAERLKIVNNFLEGEKEFIFTLIPEKAGNISETGFTLTYFNPESGRYETSRSADLSFSVVEDPSRRQGIDLEGDGKGEPAIEFNYFIIAGIFIGTAGIIVLVMVWERRRRRAVVKIQNAEIPAPESHQQEDIKEKYLRDMRAALRRPDAAKFFHSAEKMLLALQEEPPAGESTDSAMAARLRDVREKLYFYKYGGGESSPESMDRMYALIKKIHDELKSEGRVAQS